MVRSGLFAALALALLLSATACEDDDDDFGLDEHFFAELNSANEVPAVVVASNATGEANFEGEEATVQYDIDVEDITGVTLAHIHNGAAGVAGSILVTLFAPANPTGAVDGDLVNGSFTAADIQGIDGNPPISLDSLAVLMRNGNAYVNVHTTQNPNGEIRGQIERD